MNIFPCPCNYIEIDIFFLLHTPKESCIIVYIAWVFCIIAWMSLYWDHFFSDLFFYCFMGTNVQRSIMVINYFIFICFNQKGWMVYARKSSGSTSNKLHTYSQKYLPQKIFKLFRKMDYKKNMYIYIILWNFIVFVI